MANLDVESLAYIGLDPLIRGTSTRSPFSQIFSQKIVHVLAAFIFVYVGTEVTIGGTLTHSCCNAIRNPKF